MKMTDAGVTVALSELKVFGASDVHLFDHEKEREALQSLIKQVHHKISEEWHTDGLTQKASQLMQMHDEQMIKQTLQFEELVKKYEELKELKTDSVAQINNRKDELSQHKKKLQTAEKDLEQLLRSRETLHEILEKLSSEVEQEEAVLRAQEKVTQEASAELEQALGYFRERLALQMKKIPDNRLQFVFTCIDKDDPQKPFCFCIEIKPDRSYSVSDCVPHVSDFEALSQKLNETNDFKAFVKAMWKRFKLLA